VTLALLMTSPLLVGVTTMVTVADPELAMVPKLQVTVPEDCEQVPGLEAAEP
jgi:hypothetical protein